ncbi:MAG: PEP-CTERM sorting domain-containing protein [Roseibacillus sp.]
MNFQLQQLLPLAGIALATQLCESATIAGNAGDGIIQASANGATGGGATSIQGTTNARARAGNWDAGTGFNFNAVLVFPLPDLGAVTSPFASATVSFNLEIRNDVPGLYNVDLYGIDARAANTLIPADDFWVGDGVDPTATLLEDSIMTPTSVPETAGPSLVTSVDISSFLNAQYNSASVGDFVFLRLNRDGSTDITDERSGYVINTANDGDVANRPLITYTVIPEPSSLLLLSGGLALVTLRRRR